MAQMENSESELCQDLKQVAFEPLSIFPESTSFDCRVTWTPDEDKMLKIVVDSFHAQLKGNRWSEMAKLIPGRSAKQCRDRYNNFMCKNISRSKFSHSEDQIIIRQYKQFGPCWRRISQILGNRSPLQVSNRFRQKLSRLI